MTDKQKYALDKIIEILPDNCRKYFREVAEYAISLGYMPTIKGNETYADFYKSKVKKTILKICTNDPKFKPRLAMKFFALPSFSGIFHDAIEERITVYNRLGYKVGCFGCGKCDGTHGYNFTFPDGKKGFLCGGEVFTLPFFNSKNVTEVKEALKIQDDFFMKL